MQCDCGCEFEPEIKYDHRLVCGDCTDAAVVERVMGGGRAEMCFTSPPYNAGVSAQLSGNTSIGDNFYQDEYDDNQSQPDWTALVSRATELALTNAEYVFVNLQMLAGNKRGMVEFLAGLNDRLADVLIWDKGHAAPQQAQRVLNSQFEFVFVFSQAANRAIGTREFRGTMSNVFHSPPQRNNEFAAIHAATMPIDVPVHYIGSFTNNGEAVLDPFSGSGTTLIACEQLGRRCRAIEISPGYTAVALERWQVATAKTPTLLTGA